jgi:hypothetical protein
MNIVFAHFKTKFPKHLLLNIQRTVSLFPGQQVFLITDQEIDDLLIEGLMTFQFNENSEWLEIERSLDHPKFFRGNFWFTSLARFVAISAFASVHKGPLLHIESDVIISSDFPFETLSRIKSSFAYPVVSENQAIASCLFIKDEYAAVDLASFSLESVRLNKSTTDMYVLLDFLSRYPEKVLMLPSSPPQQDALTEASPEFIERVLEGIEIFGGVFDGFDIGRYLFGDDPRNDRGFSILRRNDPRTYLDVRKLIFTTVQERVFPYIYRPDNSTFLPVFSLHIHSKNLRLFRPKQQGREISKSIMNSQNEIKMIFNFSIFLNSVYLALRRRIMRVRYSK